MLNHFDPSYSNYSFRHLAVTRPGPLPPLPSPPRRGVTPETLRSSGLHRSAVPEPPTSGHRPRSSATTPVLSRASTPAPSSRTAITRQASPRVNNDNFILPSDVDEHGHLLATVTTFPRIALKIMRDWKEHLPLHMLTPTTFRSIITIRHPTCNTLKRRQTVRSR